MGVLHTGFSKGYCIKKEHSRKQGENQKLKGSPLSPRSHKSVTGILPNNPRMLPPFSAFMNFPPKLSNSCSGLIIRLKRSQCCNLNGYSVVITDVTVLFQRCGSCVSKMWQLCSSEATFVFQRCEIWCWNAWRKKNMSFKKKKKVSVIFCRAHIIIVNYLGLPLKESLR